MKCERFDTGMYVIDQDYRILNCNQEMRQMYPEVHPGDLCYKALALQAEPCATCPLYHNDVLFFNSIRGQWVSANAAHIDYPGHGLCYAIQFRVRNNVGGTKREIIHLEKIDEYLSELNASSGNECVIGAYYEQATPIFFANEHMVRLLGYETIDEVMDVTGGLGVNIMHPDDRERVKSDLRHCRKEGDAFETTFRLIQPGGNWLWVILKGRLVKTPSGQLATLSVCSSMENFLAIHDALVEELEESRKASATRDELLAIASKDQILSEITKMLYSYNLTLNLKTGRYSLIVGTGMEKFVEIFQSTDDFNQAFNRKMAYVEPRFREAARELASLESLRGMSDRKGFVQSLEYATIADGKTEWHEINVFMGTNEMGEDIANILGRDITEAHERANTKNQLAIAQAANEAKTRFLSNMSHDIRTPINGIMGMLHIAQTHRDDQERVDECLKKIEISTNYLLTLLNDILDLNKLESGKAIAEQEPFHMNELLDDIYSIIQPTAHLNGIDLKKACGLFNHPNVIGSPLHLRQILMNLLSNSIKYSKENGAACLRVTELEAQGDIVRYRFQVEDNGIGMSEEFQQKMFDMFEQEYGGARTTHKGSGLGLAIVKMLTDLLGGELSVRSAKDEGSTFTVTLPFLINRLPSPSRKERQEAQTDCLRGTRILIVEDNDFNMEIAQVILEEAGAITMPAENGRIALELFENCSPGSFDVILMDIMMPEMDGLEAARRIRRMKRPDAKTIPIIAMTANAFAEDIQKSLAAGMNDHIAKPLDMAALAKSIAKAVKR